MAAKNFVICATGKIKNFNFNYFLNSKKKEKIAIIIIHKASTF